MAYVKPVRPVLVIAANKVSEFESRKINNEVVEKIKRIAAMSKTNNEKNFK